MWFDAPSHLPDWSKALLHLRKVDPKMRELIRIVGPCTLSPRGEYFICLCQSIFSQQISTRIATILFDRFRDQFPMRKPTPASVKQLLLEDDVEKLKACGLSKQKRKYVLDLAEHFVDGRIPVRQIPNMDDEQVIQTLTAVNGIGRWTAEMFLIFELNRPDILPIDDLGIRVNAGLLDGLTERPTPKQTLVRGEIWKPYRTIASWYLWRGGPWLAKRHALEHTPMPKEKRLTKPS